MNSEKAKVLYDLSKDPQTLIKVYGEDKEFLEWLENALFDNLIKVRVKEAEIVKKAKYDSEEALQLAQKFSDMDVDIIIQTGDNAQFIKGYYLVRKEHYCFFVRGDLFTNFRDVFTAQFLKAQFIKGFKPRRINNLKKWNEMVRLFNIYKGAAVVYYDKEEGSYEMYEINGCNEEGKENDLKHLSWTGQ